MTIIRTPSYSAHQAVTVMVRRAAGSLAAREKLDGVPGRLHRLREAYDALSNDYPSVRAVPDAVTVAMQTGSRISYHPETAAAEVAALSQRFAEAQASVEALHRPEEGKPRDEAAAQRRKKHEASLQRALANLAASDAR
ncbi:MAG: hypothetical protein QM699_00050 [Amaricoccus sp.]|uniref:hypothetical protein n=1 Tax=Amaricoccus sp. TaxID=1872485 RepID=UPI0039E3AE95